MRVFPAFGIPALGIPGFGVPTVGIPAFGILVEFRHPLVRHPLDSPQDLERVLRDMGVYLALRRWLSLGHVCSKGIVVKRLWEASVWSLSCRVFLNPWFGEPVVCTLDSRGFRHFRGFRDFRESSTQLLVCSCLSCLRRFRRFRDFRHFRERRPAPKP